MTPPEIHISRVRSQDPFYTGLSAARAHESSPSHAVVDGLAHWSHAVAHPFACPDRRLCGAVTPRATGRQEHLQMKIM